jgi:hypothetical protein
VGKRWIVAAVVVGFSNAALCQLAVVQRHLDSAMALKPGPNG